MTEHKKLQPEIRFAGFTDDWEQRKLRDVIEKFEYGLNAQALPFDGLHKYIRITDIDDESRTFLLDNLTTPDVNFKRSQKYKLIKNDIVFARTGASVGKTYLYNQNDGELYFAGFLIRGNILQGFNAHFIFQITLNEQFKHFIQTTSQRSGQPGINAKEYSSFEFLCPSLEEQTQIGNFFKHLDDTIALHQRTLEKYQKLKISYLEKMFPKENKRYPELRFPNFTDAWEQRKLGECFNERTERSSIGELISVTMNSGVIKASDLDRKDNSSKDKSNYKKVEIGDIAYNSMRMWQGSSGESTFRGILSPAYTVLIPNKDISSTFFSYYFKLERMLEIFKVNSQGLTSDTWNLKYPTIAKIVVSVPTLKEQIQIGNFFKQLDDTIALHQRELEKFKILKTSYLENIFLGKVSLFTAKNTITWEQRKLEDVSFSYSGGTPSVNNLSFYGGSIPFIRSGEINDETTELFITEEGLNNSSAKLVEKGNILYALYGATSGEVGRAKIHGAINQAILAIVPYVNYDSEFIAQWLRRNKYSIISTYLQGGQGNLSGEIVKNLILELPPSKEEQTKIGNFFKQLDDTIALHQKELAKYQQIKAACLEKMFVE